MEKRVSPLSVATEEKKSSTVKKENKAPKEVKPVEIIAEPKPVAKRVNPINLEKPADSEAKVVTSYVAKVVEKVVEVEKEAPYVPAMKVNDLQVARKMKFFFKLSKVITDALSKENPDTPLNVNVENACLEGLKASNKELYEEVIKALKGE